VVEGDEGVWKKFQRMSKLASVCNCTHLWVMPFEIFWDQKKTGRVVKVVGGNGRHPGGDGWAAHAH
jgi:hypothetical protein